MFDRIPVKNSSENMPKSDHSFLRMYFLNLFHPDEEIARLKNARMNTKLEMLEKAIANVRDLSQPDAQVQELSMTSDNTAIMRYIATKLVQKMEEIRQNPTVRREPPEVLMPELWKCHFRVIL